MRGDALAHREHFAGKARRLERGNAGNGRRRRRAQQVLENPLAANDRRRSIGIRRHGQDAAVPEQSSAMAVGRQDDAAEAIALHVGDAVVARQPLVEERVVSAQQIERAAILADDAVDEHLGLDSKRFAQRVVEVGEVLLDRNGRRQIAQEQPLPRELLDERRRSGRRQSSAGPGARGQPGSRRRRCSARRSSSSSGMLFHRKNDRRDASSRSLMRYGVFAGTPAGSASTRSRNSGLMSRRCSA